MGTEAKYVAPADAEEFYRNDGAYVQGLARKLLGAGGNLQDAEDMAADIMERLLSARNDQGENALEQYNPNFKSEHTGQRVSWRTFLSGKVALYMRGKREQAARRNGRELLLCDTQAGEGGIRWVELFGGEQWDDYPVLSDSEFSVRMRDYLATLPGYDGPVSLLAVFDEICAAVAAGREDAPLARLGLPKADAAQALDRLREAVPAAASAPAPGTFDVEGVALSAAEVREAIDLLKAGKGNHVHTPLKNHRLQLEGPRGWYHSFSEAERRLYPEVGIDPQTHAKPADHVKRAVIHRLERLLAEAGHDEPEPDVTREELLEAELWHIKGLDAGQVDEILAAVRKVHA